MIAKVAAIAVEAVNEQWEGLKTDIRRSIRYHMRRVGFFERMHNISSFVSVMFGSAAVFSILKEFDTTFSAAIAGFVAAVAAVDLVWGTSSKARLHHDLARRFNELEQRMVLEDEVSSDKWRNCYRERLSIEADEPPVLRVLDCLCHNEIARSMGLDNQVVEVSWYQQLFSNFVDLWPEKIRPKEP